MLIADLGRVANDLAPLLFLMIGLPALILIGRRRQRQLSAPVALSHGQLYAAFVRAYRRNRNGYGGFVPLRNGLNGILLTVSQDAIELTAVGGGLSRLARLIGVHYEASPAEVAVTTGPVAQMYVGSFAWGAKESVILKPLPGVRRKIFALYPLDGDLARLKAALEQAGVAADVPEDRATSDPGAQQYRSR